jgi:hypothetical protein
MMRLCDCYEQLLRDSWQGVFRQQRTLSRAIQHALALASWLGRHTISRTICALGRQFRDWSADYRLFSRRRWQAERLFDGIIADYLQRHPRGPIPLAFDDTAIAKTGKKIRTAFWQYDPMSPPFRAQLLFGLRFITAALLYPHYRQGGCSARAFPIRFQQAPVVKKPGKRASVKQLAEYRKQKKKFNLSTQAVAVVASIRSSLDRAGASHRTCLVTTDGSYCNKTVFKAPLDRVEVVARCRKDARLCRPAAEDSRRWYDPHKFTPEKVRKDDRIDWKVTRVFFGGKRRPLRFKELTKVLWQRGAGTRRLRLLVLAPTPYRKSKKSRWLYRQPAFLLSTDLQSPARLLIQTYIDRWQIEVNHRDLKQFVGVGQAQVWNPLSVGRHPSFLAAAYSLLLLASLRCFGPGRPDAFQTLPRWRKNAPRASFLDILTLLRQEIHETPDSSPIHAPIRRNALSYAYT